jgi:hypothetical protein
MGGNGPTVEDLGARKNSNDFSVYKLGRALPYIAE